MAQQKADGIIWTEKKLVWDDFQEDNSVDKYPRSLARSFTKLYVTEVDTLKKHERNAVSLKVYALFIPSMSWVRQSSRGSQSVLAHEQLHFDIVELIARRLRKQLSEQIVTCENYNKVIPKLKRKSFSELRKLQDKYDDTHRNKWQTWVDDIRNGLAELENYKSVEVLVPLQKH